MAFVAKIHALGKVLFLEEYYTLSMITYAGFSPAWSAACMQPRGLTLPTRWANCVPA